MIRFAIIVFCFFLAFHLVAYYALIRAMFKDAKGKTKVVRLPFASRCFIAESAPYAAFSKGEVNCFF